MDVIRLKISRWNHPGLPRWALTPRTSVLIRDRERRRERGRKREREREREREDER